MDSIIAGIGTEGFEHTRVVVPYGPHMELLGPSLLPVKPCEIEHDGAPELQHILP